MTLLTDAPGSPLRSLRMSAVVSGSLLEIWEESNFCQVS
jgi:hypothetical protein